MKAILSDTKTSQKKDLAPTASASTSKPISIPNAMNLPLSQFLQRKVKMLNINDFHKLETSDGTIWYHNLQTDIHANQIVSFNFYKLRGQYFKTYPAEIATFNSAPLDQNPIDYTKTPTPIPNHDPSKGMGETEIWLHEPPENAWYAYVIYYMTV